MLKEIPIKELTENPYNPRRRFRDVGMAELKRSIEKIGLVQPLTVRKVEGHYEVICGIRRLKALQEINPGGVCPCMIVEVGDEQAKLMALTENLERENLTPIEEARALTVFFDKGELDIARGLIPSKDHSKVKSLAEKLPVSRWTISNRLALLTLPSEAQKAIEDEVLEISAAEEISRLRQIEDIKERERKMKELAKVYQGEADLEKLREEVNAYLESYREEKKKARGRLEEFKRLIRSFEDELIREIKEDLNWCKNEGIEIKETFREIEREEEPGEKAELTIAFLQSKINQISGRDIRGLDRRYSKLGIEKDRYITNISIIEKENPEECPFCAQPVRIPHIKKKLAEIEDEMKAIDEERESLNKVKTELTKRRKNIKEIADRYENAKKSYEKELGGEE